MPVADPTGQEGQESNVDLTDNPVYVQLMLEHLYSGEYRIPTYEDICTTTDGDASGKSHKKADPELLDVGAPATAEEISTSSSQNRPAIDESVDTEAPNEGHEDHASSGQSRTPLTPDPDTDISAVVEGDSASDDNSHSSSDLTDGPMPPNQHSRGSNDPDHHRQQAQYVTKVHMKLFALADSLGMETLKTYAAGEIISQVQHALEEKYTIHVGREILTTSPFDNDNEPKLKERFIKTCLDWYIDNDLRPEMMSLIGEREPVAFHYAGVIKEAKLDNRKGPRDLNWNRPVGWGAQLHR